MKAIIKQLIAILFASCLFSGCNLLSNNRSVVIPPANEFTQKYEQLNKNNSGSLVEVIKLTSTVFNSPLFKVGYIPDDNIIVGVYEKDGAIVGWIPETTEISFSHETGILTSKGLTFISSGKNIVGAKQRTVKPYFLNQEFEYIDGIALWDVRTGKIIKCITYPCQETTTIEDGFSGISVSRDGKWLVTYSESGIGVSGIPDDTPGFYYDLFDEDFSYPWHIGSVAFDEKQQRYAVVFLEGRIYLSDGPLSTDYRVLQNGKKEDYIVVSDSQIDPTGHFLVVARGETTQVINLNNGKVLFEFNVSNPELAFDETGELLFVGSESGLTIYGVKTGEKVAEYDTVGIASLTISEDNRLLIWGDSQGAIHIWAKPSFQQ